jgi:hypothetical protein
MNGEGCDVCEAPNVRVRQMDTTTIEVSDNWKDGVSKKLITIGIFACDDCYRDHVQTEFLGLM